MIQDRPICFGCERTIDSFPEIVFAPPWHDDPAFPSASFHGVCLMKWRERRDTIKRALFDHMRGECSCDPDPTEGPPFHDS